MKKTLSLLMIFVMTAALLAGCAGSQTPPAAAAQAAAKKPAATAQKLSATTIPAATEEPQNADWPSSITVMLMPNENNPDSGTKNEAFRTAMEQHLGIKVEELVGAEYAVGIEAMKAGNLEVLLVSPMSYYQAKLLAGVEPLVTTTSMGADPYKTVFITKADRDDINTMEDLRGKTFAFVDPASSSGYMYPKAKLVTELGLDADQLEQPGYFFKTVAYSGKHDASLVGVSMGDYDAVAVAYQLIGRMHDAGLINRDELKIIGETEIIPNACFVMRPDMPQTLKDKLMEFYLNFDDKGYFETLYGDPNVRFIQAYDTDYAVVDEMVNILKLGE